MDTEKRAGGARLREMTKKLIIESIAIGIFLLLCGVLQVSFFKVLGASPALVLSLVCAAGFLCGERTGAVCGIVGGFILDMLGSSPVMLLPVAYMLAGYFCGVLIRIYLKRNLLSFMIFSAVVGLLQSALTLGYLAFYTGSLDITQVTVKVLLPEYAAFLLCAPLTYLLCLGLRALSGFIISKTKKYHLPKREDS